MKTPLIFKIVPIIIGLIFAIGIPFTIWWNVSMYNDCRAHGHAAYQCSAMISGNQHYVAVDTFDDND